VTWTTIELKLLDRLVRWFNHSNAARTYFYKSKGLLAEIHGPTVLVVAP